MKVRLSLSADSVAPSRTITTFGRGWNKSVAVTGLGVPTSGAHTFVEPNVTTQTYVLDDADKLTSITQGRNTVKSFAYDAAGRTTAVTVGNDTTSVAYDYESRISQIKYPDQSTNVISYNGLDTRVSKVDSTGTRTYLRDGAYVTDPVLSDGAAVYTPGISERRSGTTKFYHPDRLGSTERLTDTNQSTTDTRQYDAFGLLVSSSGSTPTPFGFAGAWGYQEDPDSGLKLLGHRYYDPSTGRFLTRDPVKDGRNWYAYSEGNPTRFIDPSGGRFSDPHPFWEGLRKFVNSVPGPVKSWGWAIDKFKKWIRGDESGQTTTYGGGTVASSEMAKSRGGLSVIDALPPNPTDGQIVIGWVDTKEAFINTLMEPWNGVQAFNGAFTWEGRYDRTNREWKITATNTTGANSFFYHIWDKIGLQDHQFGPLGAAKQEYAWTVQ